MSETPKINVLVVTVLKETARYREGLKKEAQFNVALATDLDKAWDMLDDPADTID